MRHHPTVFSRVRQNPSTVDQKLVGDGGGLGLQGVFVQIKADQKARARRKRRV
jgi:hypothetical protein